MLKLIIPDPGLREYGGHHPAMINAIANTQAVIKGEIQLEVHCNRECTDEFIKATESKGVKITKHFRTDFYNFFYQSLSLTSLNNYINQLTKEYLSVFEQYSNKKESIKTSEQRNNTLFLYHTLNAEHATALASAIAIYNKRFSGPLNHCVFFMFNPIKHNIKGELDNRRFLNFKLAFSLLVTQENVQYYASEETLQQSYQYLLTRTNRQSYKFEKSKLNSAEIAIHPCGLLNKKQPNVTKSKRVILFTGDAKVNKGFLTLPSLVDKITKEITDTEVEFIIQYTITNDGKALKQTDEALQLQAESDKRIKLIRRFWSHEELHSNFATANCIIFNYDNNIYQNQSSGVLWLSAFYNLSMVFLTSNWLMREAEKLGCQYSYSPQVDLCKDIYKFLMQNKCDFDKVLPNNYREVLFEDIGEWLLNLSL